MNPAILKAEKDGRALPGMCGNRIICLPGDLLQEQVKQTPEFGI
jgi:hypothetical protein